MSIVSSLANSGAEKPKVPACLHPPPEEDDRSLRARLLATVPRAMRAQVEPSRPRITSGRRLALFYTRFSTAGQSELSTERQVVDCTKYADLANLSLAEDGIYSDEARSGFYIVGRERLADLLERVRTGDIEVVIIGDPSRLARDMVDLAWLYRTLKRMDVELHSAAGGKLDAAQIAMYGFLNQQQIETLVHNTKFARRAMVKDGRVPWGGGRLFGYERDGHVGGKIRVREGEREIVLDVFRMARGGVSHAGIARILNSEGRLGRRSKPWTAAMIGSMLKNPLYRGIIVYCRDRHRKDPNTLKVHVTNAPEDDWEIGFAAHLLIVDDGLWNDVQSRRRPQKVNRWQKHGPYLLTGLVQCPACNATMVSTGRSDTRESRFACSAFKYNNSCDNQRSWDMGWVEAATLGLLTDVLDDPSLYEPYLKGLTEVAEKAEAEAAERRAQLEKRLAALEAELIGTYDPDRTRNLRERILEKIRATKQAEYDQVEAALRSLATPRAVVDVRTRIADLGGLATALKKLSTGSSLNVRTRDGAMLMGAIRALIQRVVPRPIPGSRGVAVELGLAEMGFYDPGADVGAGPVRVVRGTYVPPSKGERYLAAGRQDAERFLASGHCSLDDATWSAIAALVPASMAGRTKVGTLQGRRLIEAMLLALRLRRPYSDVPASYGDRGSMRTAIGALVRSRAWAAIVPILRERAPHLLDGVDARRFDYVLQERRPRADGLSAPSRRDLLIDLISRPQGATLEEIQAETGQTPVAIRTAVSRLAAIGSHVTKGKRPDGRSSWHATRPSA